MSEAVTLCDYPGETVRVTCDVCGRSGRYPRARLIERFGADAGLPDVLRELADCTNWGAGSQPCGAHFPDLA
ncbi:hypothetical protein CKO28_22695 [Rhodovibrio sodomensis]|uniref:Uncharacterized protein n=1 Tax=Rhodovibrio sodomensis TaxID=1088 RepID=A0ABS1DK01_9PROT|nr:hypothetical protein [Rhodovibrio sodomensis]MBK1670830.1 hypothetical protein [Rhodovibrio sodomensis]